MRPCTVSPGALDRGACCTWRYGFAAHTIEAASDDPAVAVSMHAREAVFSLLSPGVPRGGLASFPFYLWFSLSMTRLQSRQRERRPRVSSDHFPNVWSFAMGSIGPARRDVGGICVHSCHE